MGNSRKTIVALHGAGMTGAVFGGLAPHLPDHHFRALTLPGHDPQSSTDLLTNITSMAAWLKEKLAGGPGDVILVGHSMGALIALAAADAPEVAGLVLIGAAAKMPVNADLLKIARETPNEAIGMIVKWGVHGGHPQVGAVRTVLSAVMHAANPAAVGADLAVCDNFADGAALARAVRVPALVLSGDKDKMVKPAAGEQLAALIPDAHHVLLPECGHTAMVEMPIDTATALRDFIAAKIS
ncbi:MAG TPA: alpha/beta fold hydrolase [Patescibacteria group bacterium]|nr:alpha/beta fold hydrolase [Patescibacteria group bacterium]